MRKTLICLATYNERENLPRLVPEILQAVPDAQILVIDDNSPDGTGDWCDEFAETESRLICVHRSGKLGLGSAAIAGLRYAIEKDYQLLVNLDADFSHNPKSIPALITSASQSGVDVAVGSRYMTGGSIEGWPWRRHVSSRLVNWLARVGLGLSVSDCSGSFRCYSVDALRKLDLDQLKASGYSFYEEILLRLSQRSATFAEVPIQFIERRHGETKLGYSEALSAGWHILRLAIATRLKR